MMTRKTWLVGGAIILSLLGVIVLFSFLPEQHLAKENRVERHVSYTLIVKNTSSAVVPHAKFSVFGPNSYTGSQKCTFIDADKTFSVRKDDLNNQILQFSFENLPPFAVKVINIRAGLAIQTPPEPFSLKDRQRYLENQPELHLDNRSLQKQAKAVLGNNDMETVKKTFRWITTTMSKTGYSEKERGALYALHKKGGDCTEFMHLFIALCRINNIPARGVNGYIVTQDKRLTPEELHDWAEVYLNGKWRLVDPYNQVLMDEEEFYVVMCIHNARQAGKFFHRWQTNDPRLHIAMAK